MKKFLLPALMFLLSVSVTAQTGAPHGVNYQAVARDNYGKELVNTDIEVKFSVISGNPLGPVVYQEVHQDVRTSRYGVFSLVIGKGTMTGGTVTGFSDVRWSEGIYFLKVEVKFSNEFLDMGTMQFHAVPYALFAWKSLEPGPQGPAGPKGDPGDPASDKQTLSFSGTNLSISGGNTVNLASLDIPHVLSIIGDTLSILGGNKVGLLNQVQDLSLDINNVLKISKSKEPGVDLTRFLEDKQSLSFNAAEGKLAILNGNTVDLSTLKNDADADPSNEIQDLSFNPSTKVLNITNKTNPLSVNLSNDLTFNPGDNTLAVANGNTVSLATLKNDADADPANEIQDLSLFGNSLVLSKSSASPVSIAAYMQTLSITGSELTISGGNSINLSSLADADADPANEIQDLGYNASTKMLSLTRSSATVNLSNDLAFDTGTGSLTIANGNSVSLSSLKNDADADPANEIQDLGYNATTKMLSLSRSSAAAVNLSNDLAFDTGTGSLTIANGNSVSLSSLKNDADADPANEIQDLGYNATTKMLSLSRSSAAAVNLSNDLSFDSGTGNLTIANGNSVNLSALKNDADADPANEIQELTYNAAANTLTISGKSPVSIGSMVAFRAKKTLASSAAMPLSNVDFVPDDVEYNDGSRFDTGTGVFTAEFAGLYTFDVKYIAGTGDAKVIMIYKNGNPYETLASGVSSGAIIFRSLTIRLNAGNTVKLVINTGTNVDIGTGIFSGFKVY